jgi:hypothetical protein
MARPKQDADADDLDDPDINIGDYVLARRMKDATDYKVDDAPSISLFYMETSLHTGPLWTEGYWDSDNGGWWTAFGFLGVPVAWAPLPKTPEDWT